MSLHIERAGAQTTIQAGPRKGVRHLGVPSAGAADLLSLALANRLVGNIWDAPALEITFGAFAGVWRREVVIAAAGAAARAVAGPSLHHRSRRVRAGQRVEFGPSRAGARTYLAVAGGFEAEIIFGSASTYAPAGFGGFEGRALADGDHLAIRAGGAGEGELATPPHLVPHIGRDWGLRATPSGEAGGEALFAASFKVSSRASRMGAALEGPVIELPEGPPRPSAPIFPGAVQCPPDGRPFLLMVDAQTTGGYPVIAQVIRADRHLMGQIRPGDTVRFLRSDPHAAAKALRAKVDLVADWLPGFAFD